MSHRSEDGRAEVRGHEGGDDDDEREERDERLARQGDAAVDELRFEHPIPYFPQQRLLSPAADDLDTAPDLLKPRRLVLSVLGSAMIPSLVSTDRTRLQSTPVSVLSE
jgi:hypothetical protein